MNIETITRKAFSFGLVSLALTFVFAFARVGIEHYRETHSMEIVIDLMGIIAIVLFFIFLVCALMLWIEALIYACKSWKTRQLALNIAIVFFLLVGHFVAAFLLHVVWKRHHVEA
jgi:hypothetical protein